MYGTRNGQPAENPTTGGSSCPAGYFSSQVLGTSGIDWPLYYCSQPAEALPMDFGGMWGWVQGKLQVNPTTGASACPDGYTATPAYGQNGRDYPITYCWRPHADARDPDYDFGGMWGTVNATPVVNPTTGQASCPSGYADQTVLGTDDVDWPLHACWRPHQPGTPLELFGGIVGTINGVTARDPASAGPSCPSGYSAWQVFGTSNVDWPLSYCFACPVAGEVSLADTGACVTLTPWDGSPLPNGAQIAIQANRRFDAYPYTDNPAPGIEAFGPLWIAPSSYAYYPCGERSCPTRNYLYASSAAPVESGVFTVTWFGDSGTSTYQNLVLQASNGHYLTADSTGQLEAGAADLADAMVLILDRNRGTNAGLWWPNWAYASGLPIQSSVTGCSFFEDGYGHTAFGFGDVGLNNNPGLTGASFFSIYIVN
jgi:hypothetical protein